MSIMLRIAICDEWENSRREMYDFLTDLLSKNRMHFAIREYQEVNNFLEQYEKEEYQIIFLGFHADRPEKVQAAEKLRALDDDQCMVFFSDSRKFALKSQEVFASGYLLLPLERPKAESLMYRLIRREFPQADKSFEIKTKKERCRIPYHDILYLESQNRIVIIHQFDGAVYQIYDKLNHVEQVLRDSRFLRCQQSFLINMEHVKEVNTKFLLSNGISIPIRRGQVRQIRDSYYQYLINQK